MISEEGQCAQLPANQVVRFAVSCHVPGTFREELDLLHAAAVGHVSKRQPSQTSSAEPQYQMQRGFFANVVVSNGAAIFQLLTRKDKTLLIRRNVLALLDHLLHLLDSHIAPARACSRHHMWGRIGTTKVLQRHLSTVSTPYPVSGCGGSSAIVFPFNVLTKNCPGEMLARAFGL